VLGGGKAGDVKEPRLYVVKGAAVEYDVPGPTRPLYFRFSPDGKSAWAVGDTTARIEFGDFSAPPVVRDLKIATSGPFERTPDGKRALVHISDGQGTSTVRIYDLETGEKLKSFDTASFGARLGTGLAAAGATFASMESGRRDAQAHGRSTYTYSIYTPKTDVPRGQSIVILPDGKTVYVYDPFGSTVLAYNLETMEKGKRQDAGEGARGLFLTGGGKTLLLASSKGLHVYDAVAFGEPVVTKTDGPADLAMGPAGEALLLAKGLVAAVDPATGKVGAKSTAWKDPAIGVFLP
jgi:DNA-binding beta-propeller fold protein YncE